MEVLGPFVHIGEEMGEIPFVGLGELGAGESFGGSHSSKKGQTSNVQRPTSNVELKSL
jgi:hypothetical protein